MAFFPYGTPKTEQKTTSKNVFGDWAVLKESLMKDLSKNTSIAAYKPPSSPPQLLRDTTSGIHPEFRKVMMPMIRRILPGTIAQDIIGVQPMSGPTGSVFTMRPNFGDEYNDHTLRLTVEKVDKHWNISMRISADRLHLIEDWLKNLPKDEYWTYQKGPWSPFYVNLYDEDTVLAFKLAWDAYVYK